MHTSIQELLTFIRQSPSPFHAVHNMELELSAAGYERLYEEDAWHLNAGGKYIVSRNGSSLIAFTLPDVLSLHGERGFLITASHSDSPSFKIKEHPEIEAEKKYIKLNVEKYGGMLMAPWFDRPLSAAGRVLVKNGSRIETRLVNIDRDLLMIPSLAIHMDRSVNEGHKYNPQEELLPLFGGSDAGGKFGALTAEAAGVREEDILGMDLFLYNRMDGTVWGASEEFLSAPRLDDLECAFASMKGLLKSENSRQIRVHCVFDNEEVGSLTRQGASSTFLKDVLTRIFQSMGAGQEAYLRALASSFMISADNAHGVHPNYPAKADPVNRPSVNGGIVLKHSANQKYTTDGVSAAVFRNICRRAGVPCQDFVNRSDIPGGSTLGNLSNAQAALRTVDIGLPQLAMHSSYETAGVRDVCDLIKTLEIFFSSDIRIEKDEIILK